MDSGIALFATPLRFNSKKKIRLYDFVNLFLRKVNLLRRNHPNGSECWIGHESAAHYRREGGFYATEAGADVGGRRCGGRIRV